MIWLAEMFRDVEATLTGSLPCIHEIDPVTGEHSTSEAAPEGAANYVHTGTLTRMSEENDIKIQHQVFDPIDKWISEVDVRLLPLPLWRPQLCAFGDGQAFIN